MYSSTLPSTSALDGEWVVSATPRPTYPVKDPVPVVQETGWAPGPVWRGVENLAPPTGIRSPDSPVLNESLYRLSYSGPLQCLLALEIMQCSAGCIQIPPPVRYKRFAGVQQNLAVQTYCIHNKDGELCRLPRQRTVYAHKQKHLSVSVSSHPVCFVLKTSQITG